MKMTGLRIGVHDIAVAIGFWLFCRFQFQNLADDPGLGWHLRTGEWILKHGRIPFLDPFLAGPHTRPWVSDQWLSDIFLFWVFQTGSWPLLYWCAMGAIVLSFLVLPQIFSRAPGTPAILSSIACLLCFKLGSVHFILRPVILSFLFFSILLAGLTHVYRNVSDRKKLNSILRILYIGFPILFALWANCHPSFVIGLGALFLLPVALSADAFLLSERCHSSALTGKMLGLFVLCAAATFVNPYGVSLHESIIALGSSTYFMSLHAEWQGIDFKSPEGALFLLMAGVVIFGAFLGHEKNTSNWRCFEMFLLVGLCIFSMRTIRFLPYLAIVYAWLLPESFGGFRAAIDFMDKPLRGRLGRMGDLSGGYGIVAFLLLGASSFGAATWQHSLPLYTGTLGPSMDHYPYAAVERLKQFASSEGEVTIFSISNWGGFITWQGQGKLKPLIDDRNTLIGESFMKEYLSHLEATSLFRAYAKELGASYALLPRTLALAKVVESFDRKGIVYSDEQALIVRIER